MIVLEGLRGESGIAELCRKEGINQNLYYRLHIVRVHCLVSSIQPGTRIRHGRLMTIPQSCHE